jgi:hypothetical protein
MIYVCLKCANAAYREGNHAGRGFAPESSLVDEAAKALGEVVRERAGDNVAVVLTSHRRVLAIGGNAMGGDAWAVDVTDALTEGTVLL